MRNAPRLITSLAVAVLAIGACSKKSGDMAAATDGDYRNSPGPMATKGGETDKVSGSDAPDRFGMVRDQTKASDNRKVIRTGAIQLVVGDYASARTKLDALLAASGGYVDSTQVNHSQGSVSNATVVLRLPSATFSSILPKLRELGEITSETTNAADITAQYVDISARLASSQALEKRLLELATARDGGIEAVLAVERELARVRGEIESYEGTMRQWNDQISMSTLTLSLSTRAPAIAATAAPGLGQQISNGFNSSIQALRDFGGWLAVSIIAFLPWLVLLIPGFVIGRRFYRRFSARLPQAIVHVPAPAPAMPMPVPPGTLVTGIAAGEPSAPAAG